MRLLELTTTNFAGLKDGTYSFRDAHGEPARLVLVTGAPRAGKTALLEAILTCKEALVPYGPVRKPADRAARPGERVELSTRWRLDAEDRRAIRSDDDEVVLDAGDPSSALGAPRSLFDRYVHDPRVGKVDYFPADRALSPKDGRGSQRVPFLQQRMGRLGADPQKYACLWGWLEEQGRAAAAEQLERIGELGVLFADEQASLQKRIEAGLRRFVDTPTLLRIGPSGELAFGGDGGSVRRVEALPSSVRHALLFVLAYEMVGHQRSVVLVDDVDRGQSPSEHERFIGALAALGGDSQLIATTSSASARRIGGAALVEVST